MLPTARPETIAEIKSIVCPYENAAGRRPMRPRPAVFAGSLVRQRENLAVLEVGEDVVVRRQRVVVRGREWLVVGLDQALIFRKRIERLAHLRTLGRACLGDGKRHQIDRVVSVGDSYGGGYVSETLDFRIFFLQRRKHAFGLRRQLSGKAERLDEVDPLTAWPCELAEAPARRPPVRDDRHVPAHPVE